MSLNDLIQDAANEGDEELMGRHVILTKQFINKLSPEAIARLQAGSVVVVDSVSQDMPRDLPPEPNTFIIRAPKSRNMDALLVAGTMSLIAGAPEPRRSSPVHIPHPDPAVFVKRFPRKSGQNSRFQKRGKR